MGRARVHLKGLHVVRKRLADGTVTEYHYAWRGGPRIWDRSTAFGVHSIEYVEAFRAATTVRVDTSGTFREVIDTFLGSRDYAGLGDRTRADHRRNISCSGGIEQQFGSVPKAFFADSRIRGEVMLWRDGFSKGTGDKMMATMQRIISFAYQRGLVGEHHLLQIKKQARSNRAAIVWLPDEVRMFCEKAPRFVARILIAATETGLRLGDLRVLERRHFETSGGPDGRIVLQTQKSRGRTLAAIPVTRKMAQLVAETPEDQRTIIVNSDGNPFTSPEQLGKRVTDWRDRLGLRKELRLYDARGTVVTKLVRAGCTLGEIATHMGWTMQHASQMLEIYAALDPDMSDSILEKVDRSEARNRR